MRYQLDSHLDSQLRLKLDEIDIVLANHQSEISSLYSGRAGLAMYFFQRYLTSKDVAHGKIAVKTLESCINVLSEQDFRLSIDDSVGVFWLLSRLNSMRLVHFAPKFIPTLNDVVYNAVSSRLANSNHDFFYGAHGLLLYLLDCNFFRNRNLLPDIIDIYRNTAVVTSSGIHWNISGKGQSAVHGKNERVDLGISHGVSSTVYVLCQLFKRTDGSKEVAELLLSLVDWLLSHKNPDSEMSCFPTYTASESTYSRLAWCYGDLSTALVIMIVAKSLGDNRLRDEGRCIVRKTFKRLSEGDTGILDPSFCHGAFGVAYLYKRCFEIDSTIRKECILQMEFWMHRGLSQVGGRGPCDFSLNRGSAIVDSNFKDHDFGFLMGVAGIGLAIDSVLSGTSVNIWNRFLMLE